MKEHNSILDAEFFQQDALTLAEALLGCVLVHTTPLGATSGMIVETEAYTEEDAASHSYRGETERTKVMFGPGGHAYVYFTYGMHYCFNVVSGPAGKGEAVLIRALEPVLGEDLMQKRRGRNDNLTNGPAKLVQAMGITKADYGRALYRGDLHILSKPLTATISSGPRIGISKETDKPWRYWVSGNVHVSK